ILKAHRFSINMGIPEAIGSGVTKLSVLLNHQMKSVIGFRPFDPEKDYKYNPEKLATSCETRGEYAHLMNVEASEKPVWSPSWNWLSESMKATKKVTQKENV